MNRTFANSPALFYLETRNWISAAVLKPDRDAEVYNQAIAYWAQAVAAGHLHNLAVATKAVDQYNGALDATSKGPKPNIAKYMLTRRDEAEAWLLLLQGHAQAATALLRKVADRQDVEGKGEIEIPALAEYERSIKFDPNRFNGVYGAAHAAELLGNRDKELTYYSQLLKQCAQGSHRPELGHAKQVLQQLTR